MSRSSTKNKPSVIKSPNKPKTKKEIVTDTKIVAKAVKDTKLLSTRVAEKLNRSTQPLSTLYAIKPLPRMTHYSTMKDGISSDVFIIPESLKLLFCNGQCIGVKDITAGPVVYQVCDPPGERKAFDPSPAAASSGS